MHAQLDRQRLTTNTTSGNISRGCRVSGNKNALACGVDDDICEQADPNSNLIASTAARGYARTSKQKHIDKDDNTLAHTFLWYTVLEIMGNNKGDNKSCKCGIFNQLLSFLLPPAAISPSDLSAHSPPISYDLRFSPDGASSAARSSVLVTASAGNQSTYIRQPASEPSAAPTNICQTLV
jgi:hypothetical protein